MTLGTILERFLREVPIAVMYRALLERVFDPTELDELFERNARDQYTRDVLFAAVVELMAAVVFGVKAYVRAAYLRPMGDIAASLTAVYEKLERVEPDVCRALVRETSEPLRGLVDRLGARLPVPVEGYRVKVVDGNHLAGTDHRVPATRKTRAAALPGQALVVLDLAAMLVDVAPARMLMPRSEPSWISWGRASRPATSGSPAATSARPGWSSCCGRRTPAS